MKFLLLVICIGYLCLVWWLERRRQKNNPWSATPTERRIRIPRLRDKRKSSSSCDHLP